MPTVVLGDLSRSFLARASLYLFFDDLLFTFFEHIRTTFQEQHPEDVFLEFRGIHLAAQNVGGFEHVAFELIER